MQISPFMLPTKRTHWGMLFGKGTHWSRTIESSMFRRYKWLHEAFDFYALKP